MRRPVAGTDRQRHGDQRAVVTVVSGISFRVWWPRRRQVIGGGRMCSAVSVPAVGLVVVGMIVLAHFENGLPSLMMGPIPGNGMMRRLDRERRDRG